MQDREIQSAKEVPIIEVLERLSIPYKMGGSNPVILCPFHSETEGSMTIYDDGYFCFGCEEKGDSIDMVRKLLDLSFQESVELLNMIAQGK